MNPSRQPSPLEPEGLGDPMVIIVDGSRPGRIQPEIITATPEQRRARGPFLAFLRTLPKPPAPERISIMLADPALLAHILSGRLSVGSLDIVDRVVGLHVILPDDRWGQSSPVAAWVAILRDRLRARLHGARRAPARRTLTTR